MLGELGGKIDRRDHAIGSSDVLTGNIERRSVIRRCADKWQPKRDIHARIKSNQLKRRQPLIVIHRNHGIEFAVDRSIKYCVSRTRSNGVGLFDSRSDNALLFVAEQPPFPGVRIQTCHCNAGLADAKLLAKLPSQLDHFNYFFPGDQAGNLADRRVRGDQRNAQVTSG